MKKAIVLLAIGFSLTYCNPSQQADQTTTDTGRTGGGNTMTTTPGTDTAGGGGGSTDTTSHPDTSNHPGLIR